MRKIQSSDSPRLRVGRRIVAMKLTRDVRFSLTAKPPELPVTNSWAGWPTFVGLSPYVTLRVTVTGEVDRQTGYLCNITVIDGVVRDRVVPHVRSQWLAAKPGTLNAEGLLLESAQRVAAGLPQGVELAAMEVLATPYLVYAYDCGAPDMVSLTQTFEFAAAHRLFCPQLTEERNKTTFGKCMNPNGHGHNYRLEVTVRGKPDETTGVVLPVGELESVVKDRVLDAFDHKHLNEDCDAFRDLNPTVENIVRVIWSKLEGRFGAARLECVRVWETSKTAATYRGEGR